jgi:hypothetical protein
LRGPFQALPEERRARRGGDGRAEVAEVRSGGRLTDAVRRLFDQRPSAHGVIDGAGERRAAVLGIEPVPAEAARGGEAGTLLRRGRQRLSALCLGVRGARVAARRKQQRGDLGYARGLCRRAQGGAGLQVAGVERHARQRGARTPIRIVVVGDGGAAELGGHLQVSGSAQHVRA